MVEWQIVLTKCDLLTPEQLAQSLKIVEDDLYLLIYEIESKSKSELKVKRANKLIIPLCASTGAGINNLWHDISECANRACYVTNAKSTGTISSVKEHIYANELKRLSNNNNG